MKGIKIADYAWLNKTQRSFHVWIGNPFCVGKYIIPLKSRTEKSLISDVKKQQQKEKKRFNKLFPRVKWDGDHGR